MLTLADSMHSLSVFIAQLLAAGFLAVLFLQSGLDKVFDWKGNKDYIGGYFAKTPLKALSTPMLLGITVLEVLAGVSSAAGVLVLLVTQRPSGMALFGAVLSALNVLALFFGQRLAKDYASASGMMGYALFTVGAVLLQGTGL